MNLGQLRDEFRRASRDTVVPYLWGTLDVLNWLSEAEEEACIRASLLLDDSTAAICEVAVSAGTREYAIDPRITEVATASLTDAGGEDYRLRVVTRQWLDRHEQDWRHQDARRPEALMHLSKRVAFEVEPDADYDLNMVVYRKPLVALAARQDVTFQDAGDTVTHTAHGHANGEAVLFSSVNLTTGIETETVYYIRDAALDTYSLCAVPGGAVLPLTTNGSGQVIYLDAEPEIEAHHHIHLVDWALHRAYSVPDSDGQDKGNSAKHFTLFEAHFGAHPGADMRRMVHAEKPRAIPTWC